MLSDWWSYELADLILFSSHTYYRLIELYNIAVWPLQLLAIIASCTLAVLVLRRPDWHGKAISIVLAASWLWVAWAFHWQRFSTIHWVASYFAVAFVLQALLLILPAFKKDGLIINSAHSTINACGLTILFFALTVQPFTMMITGNSWQQAEMFGIAPDPTVTATVGVLLLTHIKTYQWLMIIPILWCVVSAATLWALESINFWVMICTGFTAIAILIIEKFRASNRQ